jgi:spore germination protein KC
VKQVLLQITCLLLLTGCWDRIELKELGIVMGVALDQDPDTGEYIFTSQVLKPSALSTQAPSSDNPVVKVISTGKTIFEAIMKANQELDRRGFFAHNKIILISEDLAKEGLIKVLDSFQRGKEIRGYVYICIVRNMEAREILASNSTGIEPIHALHLKKIIENTDYQFNAAKMNMLRFYKESLGSGIAPVVGVMELKKDNQSNKHIQLSGGAVFKKDQLVGYLNEKETRGYRWGKGEVKSGALSVHSIVDEDRFVSVEVKKVKSKITPIVKGNDISFHIQVYGEGIIVEEQSTATWDSNTEKLQSMRKQEKKIEQIFEEEIKMAVEKSQKELQADILGFGNRLYKKKPKTWNKIKMDWDEIYVDLPFTVSVTFTLNSTGLMKGPFQSEN